MWLLVSESSPDVRFTILGDQKYVVGRQHCEITISDASVSRRQAVLTMAHYDSNVVKPYIIPTLTLEDVSKFGTFVNGKMVKNAGGTTVTLKHNDEIKFGGSKESIFRAVYEPFTATTSCLEKGPKKSLQQVLILLGGHLVRDWRPTCDLLIMSKINVTIKVICAMNNQRHIVTPQYLDDLHLHLLGQRDKPDPMNYLPEVVDQEVPQGVSFHPDIRRVTLLSGLKFYFLSAMQFNKTNLAVSTAGGQPILLEDGTDEEAEAMTQDGTVVVSVTRDVLNTLSPSCQKFVKLVFTMLRKKNLRMVTDPEIGWAILTCNIEDFCNPKSAITPSMLPAMASQSLSQLIDVDQSQASKVASPKTVKRPLASDAETSGNSAQETSSKKIKIEILSQSSPAPVTSEKSKGRDGLGKGIEPVVKLERLSGWQSTDVAGAAASATDGAVGAVSDSSLRHHSHNQGTGSGGASRESAVSPNGNTSLGAASTRSRQLEVVKTEDTGHVGTGHHQGSGDGETGQGSSVTSKSGVGLIGHDNEIETMSVFAQQRNKRNVKAKVTADEDSDNAEMDFGSRKISKRQHMFQFDDDDGDNDKSGEEKSGKGVSASNRKRSLFDDDDEESDNDGDNGRGTETRRSGRSSSKKSNMFSFDDDNDEDRSVDNVTTGSGSEKLSERQSGREEAESLNKDRRQERRIDYIEVVMDSPEEEISRHGEDLEGPHDGRDDPRGSESRSVSVCADGWLDVRGRKSKTKLENGEGAAVVGDGDVKPDPEVFCDDKGQVLRNLCIVQVTDLISKRPQLNPTSAPKRSSSGVKNFKKFKKTQHAGAGKLPTIIGGRDLEVYLGNKHKDIEDLFSQSLAAEEERERRERQDRDLFGWNDEPKKSAPKRAR